MNFPNPHTIVKAYTVEKFLAFDKKNTIQPIFSVKVGEIAAMSPNGKKTILSKFTGNFWKPKRIVQTSQGKLKYPCSQIYINRAI
ncbi:hypothetical protein ICE98_00763 [Lactococcus lactis]|nr:hypothetical protein [Lactococcus lactis]